MRISRRILCASLRSRNQHGISKRQSCADEARGSERAPHWPPGLYSAKHCLGKNNIWIASKCIWLPCARLQGKVWKDRRLIVPSKFLGKQGRSRGLVSRWMGRRRHCKRVTGWMKISILLPQTPTSKGRQESDVIMASVAVRGLETWTILAARRPSNKMQQDNHHGAKLESWSARADFCSRPEASTKYILRVGSCSFGPCIATHGRTPRWSSCLCSQSGPQPHRGSTTKNRSNFRFRPHVWSFLQTLLFLPVDCNEVQDCQAGTKSSHL